MILLRVNMQKLIQFLLEKILSQLMEKKSKSTKSQMQITAHGVTLDVDVVLECSGFYTSKEKAQAHINAGAKKVVISAPAGNDLPTIVYNVNHDVLTNRRYNYFRSFLYNKLPCSDDKGIKRPCYRSNPVSCAQSTLIQAIR